jgi:hypothetical protein
MLEMAEDDRRPQIECLWCGSKVPVPIRAAPAVEPASAPSVAADLPIESALDPTPAPVAKPLEASPARAYLDAPPGVIPEELGLVPQPDPPAPAVSASPPETPPEPMPAAGAASAIPVLLQQTPYALKDTPAALGQVALGQVLPSAVPAGGPPAANPLAAPPTPVAVPAATPNDDDDSRPYGVDLRGEHPCPECGRILAAGATVCSSCGYNLKTGARTRKVYQAITRSWEPGWSFERRRNVFILGQVVALPLGILGWIRADSFVWAFLIPWLILTVGSTYVLGTFSRVDLTRNKRGKVILKQTWRVCFQLRPSLTIPLGQFEGVTFGKCRDADFWDWMIVIFLSPTVVIAGLYWYYFIHLDNFFVALTKDHGHPELNLYKGWDQALMHDMAETVRAIAFPGT